MAGETKRGGGLAIGRIVPRGMVALGAIVVLAACDAPPGEASPPAAAGNDPGISASEFAAMQTGMTPEEVTAIVGSAGTVMSESDLGGIRTVMVQWEGESGLGANANAMFQNGKLIQKAQFGLE